MLRENPLMRPEPKPGKQWPIFGRLVVLAGFWLFIGFALGTVLLLYPVRWWATLSRAKGWAHGIESAGVVAIILLLVVLSFALAYWAMKWFVRTDRALVRALLVLTALGAGGAAYWKWVNPATMKANMGTEQAAGAHFTVGPYPDAVRLAELRQQGYTGVISLLHPAVVPFEPQLIAREKREAAAAGIKLIHLPMLPWVSDNTDSLERLRALAASKQGRYYIHCYLGVDRVNLARRTIEQASGDTASIEGGGEVTRRSLDVQMKVGFERGPIFRLEPGLYLTPYPTDEEFLAFFLGGGVKNVVALLNPDDVEKEKRIDYERKLFASHSVPFHLVEVGGIRYDARRILEAVVMARKLPRPTVLHSFFSAGRYRASIAEGVRIAHRTGLPPLPPSMWDSAMANGQPEVIAPHVAIGPSPTESEFPGFLRTRGIWSAIFIGEAGRDASAESAAATEAGIEWRVGAPDPTQILEMLKSGGPYYLYGPGLEKVKPAIVERYAGMMREAMPTPPAPAAVAP